MKGMETSLLSVLMLLLGLIAGLALETNAGYYPRDASKGYMDAPQCPSGYTPNGLSGVVEVNGVWSPIYSCIIDAYGEPDIVAVTPTPSPTNATTTTTTTMGPPSTPLAGP